MVIMACLIVLLSIGCAQQAQTSTTSSPAATVSTPKILKVGSIWPLSGPGAGWGIPIKNVIDFQVKQYNSAGGIKVGKDTYTLEVIHEDSKYTAAAAKLATEKLVNQDKVKYILGPISAAELNAMKTLLNEQKIINVEVNNGSDCVGPDKPYCFRPFMGIGEICYSCYKYFHDNHGVKSYLAVVQDTETSHTAMQDGKAALDELGIKCITVEYFPFGTKDFYPIMSKVLPSNPDMIEIGGGPGDMAMQLKTLKELGYKGIVYTSTPTTAASILQVVPKDIIEGYFTTTTTTEESPMAVPGVIAWKTQWEAAGNKWVDAGGGWGANFLPLIVQGVQNAGTVEDTDKVKAALEKNKFISPIYGTCEWGGLERYGINHVALYPINITRIQDGKDIAVAILQPKDMKPVIRPK
jgi:branched-chain amino acid transport system substrate-binding protein